MQLTREEKLKVNTDNKYDALVMLSKWEHIPLTVNAVV